MAKQLKGKGRRGGAPRNGNNTSIRDAQIGRLRRALGDAEIRALPESSDVRRVAEALLRAPIAPLNMSHSIDKGALHDNVWSSLNVSGDDWDKGVELADKLSGGLI